ncbi:MAG: hypothetical protein GKR89_23635 [Candidatus Latescibacteria bacterium]|nr:hypothetical protein [Candidatus Latescibacterota bacterium]
MQQEASLAEAMDTVEHRLGVVVPVYFPQGVDHSLGRRLLEDNVSSYLRYLTRPETLCLSVDGAEYGREIADDLATRLGVRVCVAPHNKGKLQAVRAGMAALYEETGLDYLAAVDADGDHFANEVVNLVRGARWVQQKSGAEVMVLGQRRSRHHPMGLLRGELEELADRVLLDALAYDAVGRGQPLALEWGTTLAEFPDFHSGFKLFSRSLVPPTFTQTPHLSEAGEDAYFKHGVEAVMTVESLLAGGRLVLVNRSTYNEQPISTFGLLNRTRMVADKIIWPCKRLGVPGPFVDQWLRNHIPRLLLGTLAPQGQEELAQIHRLVLEAYAMEAGPELTLGPLFV